MHALQVCAIFEGLKIQFVPYGSALFVLSQLMFITSLANTMHMLGIEWELQRKGAASHTP